MKNKISITLRNFTLNIFYRIGKILRINDNNISILCYHSISNDRKRYSVAPKEFEKQIDKISQKFKFISLDDVVKYCEGKIEIKNPSVAITFDDGYENFINALPVLNKYSIPVSIFVLSNPENANFDQISKDMLLNSKQLLKLLNHGVTIGCHSATHPDFKNLEQSQLSKEIYFSKQNLESKLKTEVKFFAYPKGVYNQQILDEIKNSGYQAAFSIDAATVKKGNNLFLIPRTIIDGTHQISYFPAVFSSSTFYFRNLTNKFRLWEKLLN